MEKVKIDSVLDFFTEINGVFLPKAVVCGVRIVFKENLKLFKTQELVDFYVKNNCEGLAKLSQLSFDLDLKEVCVTSGGVSFSVGSQIFGIDSFLWISYVAVSFDILSKEEVLFFEEVGNELVKSLVEVKLDSSKSN